MPTSTATQAGSKPTQVQCSSRKLLKKVQPIQDFLKVSRSSIQFGGVIPGNICEQDLQLSNVTASTLVV